MKLWDKVFTCCFLLDHVLSSPLLLQGSPQPQPPSPAGPLSYGSLGTIGEMDRRKMLEDILELITSTISRLRRTVELANQDPPWEQGSAQLDSQEAPWERSTVELANQDSTWERRSAGLANQDSPWERRTRRRPQRPKAGRSQGQGSSREEGTWMKAVAPGQGGVKRRRKGKGKGKSTQGQTQGHVQGQGQGQGCRLRQIQLNVSDLGLGYQTREEMIFRYCSGPCTNAETNYDKILNNLSQNRKLRLLRDSPPHACCRPIAYDDDLSFLDDNLIYHTMRKHSARRCGCV
ncbi:glial cell line-derived neurotrophic factor [Engraulis encrasicolus]|uniref:glial cell line-derived neurotrophic factor n=1 Tax=Engraulis encrasicolus TaxID=184585 RepID=UPI002FCEF7BA